MEQNRLEDGSMNSPTTLPASFTRLSAPMGWLYPRRPQLGHMLYGDHQSDFFLTSQGLAYIADHLDSREACRLRAEKKLGNCQGPSCL